MYLDLAIESFEKNNVAIWCHHNNEGWLYIKRDDADGEMLAYEKADSVCSKILSIGSIRAKDEYRKGCAIVQGCNKIYIYQISTYIYDFIIYLRESR